ncbi:hypothetical protein EVB53_031 [Rhizobium phage RHph_Y60]|nr:hypothetical protein EVB53_031 [Rhizobium phage RHph_Y60]
MAFEKTLTDEQLRETAKTFKAYDGNKTATAAELGIKRQSLEHRLKRCAEKGLLDYKPVLPGFRVSQVTNTPNGDFIQQKPERGDVFTVPEGQIVSGVSALVDEDGREVIKWIKTKAETVATTAWRQALDEFKASLPRLPVTAAPAFVNDQLCVQYTVTDLHFGMLAWAEETRVADYDLQIAERLLTDWFAAAIAMAPPAHTAVFAQLGDLAHYDSMETVTPTSRHVVDGDSRPQKMIRVIIRVVRRVIAMLLEKHQHVHVIMAKANHDPYSSGWMREGFAALYEDEPRITVDTSPAEYYAFEWGKTALFYHHGHRKQLKDVDATFAGAFREIFGRCPHCYGHVGHLHNDEAKDSNLMKTERHRTLAPADSYSSSMGHTSKRDAKAIVYHKEFGEVSRFTLSPEMVRGAAS